MTLAVEAGLKIIVSTALPAPSATDTSAIDSTGLTAAASSSTIVTVAAPSLELTYAPPVGPDNVTTKVSSGSSSVSSIMRTAMLVDVAAAGIVAELLVAW